MCGITVGIASRHRAWRTCTGWCGMRFAALSRPCLFFSSSSRLLPPHPAQSIALRVSPPTPPMSTSPWSFLPTRWPTDGARVVEEAWGGGTHGSCTDRAQRLLRRHPRAPPLPFEDPPLPRCGVHMSSPPRLLDPAWPAMRRLSAGFLHPAPALLRLQQSHSHRSAPLSHPPPAHKTELSLSFVYFSG